ncbi:MAG: hypothetical protein HY716_10835 [Planctomycetes bacterium]|nr:hypothetical protein [Planctomycetota bacterium]
MLKTEYVMFDSPLSSDLGDPYSLGILEPILSKNQRIRRVGLKKLAILVADWAKDRKKVDAYRALARSIPMERVFLEPRLDPVRHELRRLLLLPYVSRLEAYASLCVVSRLTHRETATLAVWPETGYSATLTAKKLRVGYEAINRHLRRIHRHLAGLQPHFWRSTAASEAGARRERA